MSDPFAAWVVALTHSGFGDGAALSARDWWPLFDPAPTSPEELAERVSASANPAVREAARRLPSAEADMENLASEGVHAATLLGERFPRHWRERLGARVPPVVFFLGDPTLLDQPAIAIVGSRDADEAALGFAAEVARQAVGRGYAVVSGGAMGVDRAAALAAARAGGSVVVLPADSFNESAAKLHRAEVDLRQVLLLTANRPDSGFSVGKAMGRNKLIYAMAEFAAVAACKPDAGGTWAGAIEAIGKGLCPVRVWTGPRAPKGNAALVAEGASGIERPEDAFAPSDSKRTASLFD